MPGFIIEKREFNTMKAKPRQGAQMEEILRELVAIRSVSGHYDESKAAIDYVAAFARDRGMDVRQYDWQRHPTLVATTQPNSKKPMVMLTAHIDVVKALDEQFTLRKEAGKLFGRGVWDMKGAIAIYLQLIDDLKEHISEYDFGLMITSDEEYGDDNLNGVQHLLFDEGYRTKVAILPDNGENWQIEVAAKGIVHFVLEAPGQSAHGSRPWEGDNAINKLVDALYELKSHFKDQNPGTDSLNIGKISGGENFNIVPPHAQAEFEIRTTKPNKESANYYLQLVEQLCAKYGIEYKLLKAFEPVEFSLDDPYMQEFATSIQKIVGIKNKGVRSLGGSDARFFAALDIPVVGVRSPGGNAHGHGEWLDIQGFQQFYEIIRDFLERVAKNKR
jgi:acetylornithine deacetylase/succinyl-diaminopimelate desuccinylase-like protein